MIKGHFQPSVDVIIPCRNEEKYIAIMLSTVIGQTYPAEKLTIWVVDGESSDKTCQIIKQIAEKNPNVRLLNNPARTTPHALNIGIKSSQSEYIVRMDCHAEYPANYISTLVENAHKLQADNIGATLETLPGAKTIKAEGIAVALSLPISVGNSTFRVGGEAVEEVDTVPFGCFDRKIFDKVGYFDEEMLRNQDDELNARIIKSGGKIFLLPFLIVKYFARSDYYSLWRMYFQYGEFKLRSNLKSRSIVSVRQFAPSILILGIISFKVFLFSDWRLLAFVPEYTYILLVMSYYAFSSKGIIRKSSLSVKCVAICATLIIHFSYGLGFFTGIIQYFFNIKKKDLKLSR